MILTVLFIFTLLWAIYRSSLGVNREYLTIVSLVSFFIYYVLGGIVFGDEYFPFEESKIYAYEVAFPVIVFSILIASVIGNVVLHLFRNRRHNFSPRKPSLTGLYLLAAIYLGLNFLFLFQNGLGVFSSGGTALENVSARTEVVYGNKLYGFVSYAAFYILPIIALVFLEDGKKFSGAVLLVVPTLAITVTGQKSALVISFLTYFFFLMAKQGFLPSIKKSFFLGVLVLSAIVMSVVAWNKGSFSGSQVDILFSSLMGVLERVTLVGTGLASEYIYIKNELFVDISQKPSDLPLSMFVYNLIESDGLLGSKPAHIFFVKFLGGSMIEAFISSFMLYLVFYLAKCLADIFIYDIRLSKAVNVWLMVAIVNATITDSFAFISAAFFGISVVFGFLMVFGGLGRIWNGSATIVIPFKIQILNIASLFAFLYFIQGFSRGFL